MNSIKYILFTLLVVIFAGCGGEDEAFLDSSSGSSSTTGSSGSTGGTVVRIGNGTGSGFTPGVLALGVSTLSAGGSTSVTADLVDASGALYTASSVVTFNSTCVGAQTATITSPITTTNGVAVSTYVAKGCEGADTITATTSVGGVTIAASVDIYVLAANLGSIQFVSATPSNIALRGTGGAGLSETSTVVFKVLNSVGGIVPKRDVTFELSTSVGGITISPATATTDANGLVQTVVQGGTQNTPVRVKATVAGTNISTQSDQLTITTGIPDQDSSSLSATQLNIEGWDYDGVETVLTARLSDHFSNPVPNGTTVNFISEGGQVGGSCSILQGACSVSMFSANLRPTNGRVSVLAYAIGEESFTNYNGDGLMNAGEAFDANGNPTDRGEAYVDYDEDGTRQATEPYVDFNTDNVFQSAGDGLYNGVLCDGTSVCSAQKSINVRRPITIVFSGSTANISISASPIVLNSCANGTAFTNTPVGFNVTISDVNGNAMPAGTTVQFTTTNGTIDSTAPDAVADTTACLASAPGCPASASGLGSYQVVMSSDATQSAAPALTCTNPKFSGTFNVKVTTPKGVVTTGSATVTD